MSAYPNQIAIAAAAVIGIVLITYMSTSGGSTVVHTKAGAEDNGGSFRGPARTRHVVDESVIRPALAMVHAELTKNAEKFGNVEGYSAQVEDETLAYLRLAVRTDAEVVCEIGFNAGHSTATWLAGSPNIRRYIGFDLGQHDYVDSSREIASRFGADLAAGRGSAAPTVEVIKGDSRKTLLMYKEAHPDVVCDLFHVDGGHYGSVPFVDLANSLHFLRKGGIVIMDDYSQKCVGLSQAGCDRPTVAWDDGVQSGVIQTISAESPSMYRGWAIGRKAV